MKAIITSVLVLLIVILGVLLFKQNNKLSETSERVLLLQHERDSVMANVAELEVKSDSALFVIDSLTDELSIAKITSTNIIKRSEKEIDSLSTQLDSMIPKNIIGDSIRVAIIGIQNNYELQMAELRRLLQNSDRLIAELQNELNRQREINANLMIALDLTTEQRDNWEKLANPSFFDRIKNNIGLISTSIGIGLLTGGILLGG